MSAAERSLAEAPYVGHLHATTCKILQAGPWCDGPILQCFERVPASANVAVVVHLFIRDPQAGHSELLSLNLGSEVLWIDVRFFQGGLSCRLR